MADYREMAVEFMNKQAGVRPMSPAEFAQGVKEAEEQFRAMYEPEDTMSTEPQYACDPKTAIKDRTITCVVCGKQFKIITKQHLLAHGMTPESYCEFAGYKKGTPLLAKQLQRERRSKMKELRLWERDGSGAQRNKAKAAEATKTKAAEAAKTKAAEAAKPEAKPASAPKPAAKPAVKPTPAPAVEVK